MQDPTVAAAGRLLAEALGSGTWTEIRDEVTQLFTDIPAVEGMLHADAQLIATVSDRDRAMHDVAQMWGLRIAGALSRNPELTATVAKLAGTRVTYNQHNTPGAGGTVFANQGGAQNVYRLP